MKRFFVQFVKAADAESRLKTAWIPHSQSASGQAGLVYATAEMSYHEKGE